MILLYWATLNGQGDMADQPFLIGAKPRAQNSQANSQSMGRRC